MTNYERQILFASLEDYPPLSEIVWEINSLTNTKDAINQKIAFDSVCKLLNSKYIQLYQSDGFQGSLKLIDAYEEVYCILNNPSSWEAKACNESMIRIGITEIGENLIL